MGCMISYMPRYPYTCHPNDVLLAKQEEKHAFKILWRCSSNWEISVLCKNYFAEHGIDITFAEEDAAILGEGTVDYYTFSYYLTLCVSADDEVEKTDTVYDRRLWCKQSLS